MKSREEFKFLSAFVYSYQIFFSIALACFKIQTPVYALSLKYKTLTLIHPPKLLL
jgi:hypothetical protein